MSKLSDAEQNVEWDSNVRRRANIAVTVVTTHAPSSRGWGGAVMSGVEAANIIAGLLSQVVLVCCDANNRAGPVDRSVAERATQAKLRLYKSRVATKLGFGWGAIPILFAEIRRADAAYVSGISTWPVTVAALIAMLLQKPYIVSLHGGLLATHVAEIRSHRRLKNFLYNVVVLPLVRRAAFVRVSSEFEKRDASLLIASDKIVAIPNTFDLSAIPYSQSNTDTPGTHLIYVGRLEADKGIRAFLQVWMSIAGEQDRISVLGSGDGSYAADVLKLAAGDGRISVLGEASRTQVYAELAGAHALVLPSGLEGSLRENFGNVVVEALSVGRPALVTRGLAWDQLPANGIGWTFDPNKEELELVLRRLLGHKLAHDPEMSEKCRKFAEQHFSNAAARTALFDLIKRCVAARQKRIYSPEI